MTESKCTICGVATGSPEVSLCPSCRRNEDETIPPSSSVGQSANEATIAPTPGLYGGTRESQQRLEGQQFGEYELLDEIARGGMGVVFKARHRKLDRVAAIKMILGGKFSGEEELQRFHIEAAAAAKLDHPGIVPVYEVGEAEGQAYFAMKYIDGGSLAEKMDSLVEQPRVAVKLLAQVARAVYHAHQRGILHRDLKPANVLIDTDQQPLLTDLGLAKSSSGGSDLTHTGAVLGTPSYMPPEQASGENVTTAADIYSLGAIFYEMLTGRPPYQGESAIETLMQVLESPPEKPTKINSSIDRDLELICLKCLAREPDQRYATASGLADDLEAWLKGEAISVKPPTVGAIAGRLFRKNRKTVYVAFGLMAGAIFGLPFLLVFAGDPFEKCREFFPDSERPLLFRLYVAPDWIPAIMAPIFFLAWPLIGFFNARISSAKSLKASILQGTMTAILFSLVLLPLLGGIVVLQTSWNFTNGQIGTLSRAVWASEEKREDALAQANLLFGGVEDIPLEERASVVAARIRMEQMGSILFASLILLIVLLIFSVPIIFGTVFGNVLKTRRIHFLIKVVRYFIAWWAGIVFLVFAIMSVATLIVPSESSMPFYVGLIGVSITSAVIYLALRRYKKDVNESASGVGLQQGLSVEP